MSLNAIRMRLFPMSLNIKATYWLYEMPDDSPYTLGLTFYLASYS